MLRRSRRWRLGRWWIVVAGSVALFAASCSGGGEPEETTVERAPRSSVFEAKPSISLVVNDWTASALNVAIAEQLIERHLGYPVLPVRLDDTTEIYEGLADGRLDAVLEVWPSNINDRDRRYFERGEVLDLGPLGSTGKIGWFVPRYLIDDDPSLLSWEAFADPQVAARFATSATAPAGRFLGTNPDYQQHDQEIIDNLGLPFQVEFSGSETATIAELEATVAERRPLLLYWWSPTTAVARFDLVNVALPARTDACVQSARDEDGRVNCDYPTDELLKVASLELAEKAPDVSLFLSRFTLTTDDQLGLLVAVEDRGETIDRAAAEWIAANEERWRAWLEA